MLFTKTKTHPICHLIHISTLGALGGLLCFLNISCSKQPEEPSLNLAPQLILQQEGMVQGYAHLTAWQESSFGQQTQMPLAEEALPDDSPLAPAQIAWQGLGIQEEDLIDAAVHFTVTPPFDPENWDQAALLFALRVKGLYTLEQLEEASRTALGEHSAVSIWESPQQDRLLCFTPQDESTGVLLYLGLLANKEPQTTIYFGTQAQVVQALADAQANKQYSIAADKQNHTYWMSLQVPLEAQAELAQQAGVKSDDYFANMLRPLYFISSIQAHLTSTDVLDSSLQLSFVNEEEAANAFALIGNLAWPFLKSQLAPHAPLLAENMQCTQDTKHINIQAQVTADEMNILQAKAQAKGQDMIQ